MGFDGLITNGVGWDRLEWDEQGCTGMDWDGMRWDGIGLGWDGVERDWDGVVWFNHAGLG